MRWTFGKRTQIANRWDELNHCHGSHLCHTSHLPLALGLLGFRTPGCDFGRFSLYFPR